MKNMALKFIFPLVIFLSLLPAPQAVFSENAQAGKSEFLTIEERIWLDSHSIIRLAPDPDFAPIEYIDKRGRFQGMAADFLALVEEMLDIRFTIVPLRSWDEVLRRAQTREVDMLGAATKTPERSKYMLFTKSYIVLPGAIIVRNDMAGSFDMEKNPGDESRRRVGIYM